MKFRIIFFTLGLVSSLGYPIHALAEYEWCQIVRDPGHYQIVIEGVHCPVKRAKYIDRELKVNYECNGPEGVRRGRFYGRQIDDSSFKGRYRVQSKLGAVHGPLEISFLGEDQIMMESRGKQYSGRIALNESE